MARFDLADFLEKTGFSLRRLATYLQVAPGYLEAARPGETRLTARDQAACRPLLRRLFQGKQLELPFAEPLETFTRDHARSLARAAAAGAVARALALLQVQVRVNPDHYWATSNLSVSYDAHGRGAEAAAMMLRAAELRPNNLLAVTMAAEAALGQQDLATVRQMLPKLQALTSTPE